VDAKRISSLIGLLAITAMSSLASAEPIKLHCHIPGEDSNHTYYDVILDPDTTSVQMQMHLNQGSTLQFSARVEVQESRYVWASQVHLPHVIYNINSERYILDRETLFLTEIYPGVGFLGSDVKIGFACEIAVNRI
jgi:hypothetical protein